MFTMSNLDPFVVAIFGPPLSGINMSVNGRSKLICTDCRRVCVASWVCVYYLGVFKRLVDIPWVSRETATWSSVESSLGIVSACLPILRPLYSRMRKGLGLYNSTENSPFHGPSLGSDWHGRSAGRGKHTNVPVRSRGPSEEVACADADRMTLRFSPK